MIIVINNQAFIFLHSLKYTRPCLTIHKRKHNAANYHWHTKNNNYYAGLR